MPVVCTLVEGEPRIARSTSFLSKLEEGELTRCCGNGEWKIKSSVPKIKRVKINFHFLLILEIKY